MERDEQGIIVEEQAKLGEIKIHILHLVHPTHHIDVLIIHSITVFQQQEILDVEIADIIVHRLSGISVAGSGTVFAAGRGAQILVDIDVHTAHCVHFGNGAVQKLIISGAIGTIKA